MNELVLIADDEQDLTELLKYNLEKENYRVLIAQNGKEAIHAIQRYNPDLVVLDVMMPELNGWEVCRILRCSSNGETIPIIMLTALSSEESRIKGLSLGADDYLSKPFSMKELMLKIQKNLERRHIMKQLQEKEQDKESSLRYFVHEMGNALTTISGFSSLALRKDSGHHHLRVINNTAIHAECLLKDATLLSRLEKEGGTLQAESVDIVALVKEVVDIFRDKSAAKHIKIAVMQSTGLLAKVNKTGIRQVLINLVSNAIKYSRSSGNIWISFGLFENCVKLTIKDEGCGIRQEEIPLIFNKFYRAAGSELEKGSGLGLYIVKLLTESMGGTVTAVSEQNTGSAFTVSFPIARSVAAPSMAQETV
jgi:two-component system, sensor histidine kinase and response regulator